MYCIAICDDEQDYIDEIKEMILECTKAENIVFLEFHSGEELLEKMPLQADVLILDILLKGMDGNQIAVKVKNANFRGLLVQCSGIYAPTTETIVISPYRYLQKQDPREKNLQVLVEILEEMVKRKAYSAVMAESGNKKEMIRVEDIAYISRHRRGCEIHLAKEYGTKKHKIICTIPFEELQENLKEQGFAFPHNSYIVNLRYLRSISKNEETISVGNCVLTIARSKRKEFIQEFIEYANRKYKEDMNEV